MIDTSRITTEAERFKPPSEWEVETSVTIDHNAPEDSPARYRTTGKDPRSGLRFASVLEGGCDWLEVSLPKFHHGRNSACLNPDEVEGAVGKLVTFCQDNSSRFKAVHATRVDLVAQYDYSPRAMIDAHKNVRHKRVRRNTAHFFDSGLTWPGDEIRIRLYDKALEEFAVPGTTTRLEGQLRQKALRGMFGSPRRLLTLDRITGENCYQAYRRLVQGFRESPVLETPNTIAGFLQIALREGWETKGGLSAFDLYTFGKSASTRRRLRREVAGASLKIHEIDWDAWLPKDWRDSRMIFDYAA